MPTSQESVETVKQRVAACSCGQLSAIALGEPVRVSICHCLACQRRSGSVFAAQARFLKECVTIRGTAKQYVRVSDEGNQVVFNFCPHCGATVYYQVGDEAQSIAIAVGAFADPGFPAPSFSVYEERMHAWVGLPENIEHMA